MVHIIHSLNCLEQLEARELGPLLLHPPNYIGQVATVSVNYVCSLTAVN